MPFACDVHCSAICLDFCSLRDLVCGRFNVRGAASAPVRMAPLAGDSHDVSFCVCISNYGCTGCPRNAARGPSVSETC
jgi:hypothetical protein